MSHELMIWAGVFLLVGIIANVIAAAVADKTEKITGHGMGWCCIATSILFYLQAYSL